MNKLFCKENEIEITEDHFETKYVGKKVNHLFIESINIERTLKEIERVNRGEIKRAWYYYNCICDCGNKTVISRNSLNIGVNSCGCMKYKKPKKDISGQQFGKLTAIKLDEERNNYERERFKKGEISRCGTFWLCECECGNKNISVRLSDIQDGKVKSCGCYSKEIRKETVKTLYKTNPYEFINDENGKYIKFYNEDKSKFGLISIEDEDLLNLYYWNTDSKGYWRARPRNGKDEYLKLHQEVAKRMCSSYNPSINIVPDHLTSKILGVQNKESDNRRENLRIVSTQDNSKNTRMNSSNTSGVKGICYDNTYNRWMAYIHNNEKKQIIKYFSNKEDAIKQRKEWEKEFGYIGE